MSKAITASLVPLFDRLTGMSASADGRLLDGGGLQQSLQLVGDGGYLVRADDQGEHG